MATLTLQETANDNKNNNMNNNTSSINYNTIDSDCTLRMKDHVTNLNLNNSTNFGGPKMTAASGDELNTPMGELILNSCSTDSIVEFYHDAVILVTGGTGFLGKALLEKLLRSCSGVKAIYALIRPKRGLTVEQRHKELLKNPIFERVKAKNPLLLDKIKVVSGDVSQAHLGLSEIDLEKITATVNIVMHSAATVRFTEPLGDAITLNTLGTKRMLELCQQIKQLKSIVHVSTAFSNSIRPEIQEVIYPPPHDPDTMIQCVKTLPKETLDLISDRLQGEHPNTYTMTKAMAESVIMHYGHDLPICIVRPSIVTAAYQEPFPGWIDNVYGVTGIVMEISRGTYRSGYCREQNIMDVVPVDIAVNTCLAAGWHTVAHRSNGPRVYNCTSGQLNGISWGEFIKIAVKYSRMNPTKYLMLYPSFGFTTSRFVNTFWEVVAHFLPCLLYDLVLRAQGNKPIMVKLAKRFKLAAITGEYFANNEWKFEVNNVLRLVGDAGAAKDGDVFPLDVRAIKWDDYVGFYMLGIRKYVLKDSLDSLPHARKKLQRLYWVHRFIQAATGFYLFKMAFGRR